MRGGSRGRSCSWVSPRSHATREWGTKGADIWIPTFLRSTVSSYPLLPRAAQCTTVLSVA
jgi:hypothetical protein